MLHTKQRQKSRCFITTKSVLRFLVKLYLMSVTIDNKVTARTITNLRTEPHHPFKSTPKNHKITLAKTKNLHRRRVQNDLSFLHAYIAFKIKYVFCQMDGTAKKDLESLTEEYLSLNFQDENYRIVSFNVIANHGRTVRDERALSSTTSYRPTKNRRFMETRDASCTLYVQMSIIVQYYPSTEVENQDLEYRSDSTFTSLIRSFFSSNIGDFSQYVASSGNEYFQNIVSAEVISVADFPSRINKVGPMTIGLAVVCSLIVVTGVIALFLLKLIENGIDKQKKGKRKYGLKGIDNNPFVNNNNNNDNISVQSSQYGFSLTDGIVSTFDLKSFFGTDGDSLCSTKKQRDIDGTIECVTTTNNKKDDGSVSTMESDDRVDLETANEMVDGARRRGEENRSCVTTLDKSDRSSTTTTGDDTGHYNDTVSQNSQNSRNRDDFSVFLERNKSSVHETLETESKPSLSSANEDTETPPEPLSCSGALETKEGCNDDKSYGERVSVAGPRFSTERIDSSEVGSQSKNEGDDNAAIVEDVEVAKDHQSRDKVTQSLDNESQNIESELKKSRGELRQNIKFDFMLPMSSIPSAIKVSDRQVSEYSNITFPDQDETFLETTQTQGKHNINKIEDKLNNVSPTSGSKLYTTSKQNRDDRLYVNSQSFQTDENVHMISDDNIHNSSIEQLNTLKESKDTIPTVITSQGIENDDYSCLTEDDTLISNRDNHLSQQQQQQQQEQKDKDNKIKVAKTTRGTNYKRDEMRMRHDRNIALLPPLKEESQQNSVVLSATKSEHTLGVVSVSRSKIDYNVDKSLPLKSKQDEMLSNSEKQSHLRSMSAKTKHEKPIVVPSIIYHKKNNTSMDFSCITEDSQLRHFVNGGVENTLPGVTITTGKNKINSMAHTPVHDGNITQENNTTTKNEKMLITHLPGFTAKEIRKGNNHIGNTTAPTSPYQERYDAQHDQNNNDYDYSSKNNSRAKVKVKTYGKGNVPQIVVPEHKNDEYSCMTEDTFLQKRQHPSQSHHPHDHDHPQYNTHAHPPHHGNHHLVCMSESAKDYKISLPQEISTNMDDYSSYNSGTNDHSHNSYRNRPFDNHCHGVSIGDNDNHSQNDSYLTFEGYDTIQRECYAPPGKLGVTVTSIIALVHNEIVSIPVVNKVKEGSPLEGRFFPGDKIVAINDISTIGMSASAVTKLMVEFSSEMRKISFVSGRYEESI